MHRIGYIILISLILFGCTSRMENYTTPDGLDVYLSSKRGTVSGYVRNADNASVAKFLINICNNGPGGAYPKADGTYYFYCGHQVIPEN